MKLFTRCRILANVLTAVCALLGIVLGLQWITPDTYEPTLFFWLGCCVLFVLLVIVIALKCLIKDVEDDVK